MKHDLEIGPFRFWIYKANHTRFKPYWRARAFFLSRTGGVVRYPTGGIVNLSTKKQMVAYLTYAYGAWKRTQ